MTAKSMSLEEYKGLSKKYEGYVLEAKKNKQFLIVTKQEVKELKAMGLSNVKIAKLFNMCESSVRNLLNTKQEKCVVGRAKLRSKKMADGELFEIYNYVSPEEFIKIIKNITDYIQEEREAIIDHLYDFFYTRDERTSWAKKFLKIKSEKQRLGFIFKTAKREILTYNRKHRDRISYDDTLGYGHLVVY